MPDEKVNEGVDLETPNQDTVSDDAKAEDADEEVPGEPESSEDSDENADSDSGGEDPGGLGDLMDIFSDESDVEASDAGLLDEFLEELTMNQVSEEADRLLEEFRAI